MPNKFNLYKKIKINSGQSLLEIIVALAIFSLIAVSMISMLVGSFVALEQGIEHTEAENLAQEGIEAVRAIHDRAWNEIIYNQSGVSTSSDSWSFLGEATTENIGQYTRIISFEDVCRNSENDITICPGDYTDVHSKKVTSNVSWITGTGVENYVEQVTYLTNWDSINWTQTDWSGGDGQTIWSNITRYDYDDGNVVVSNSGEASLDQTLATSGTNSWPFTIAGNYTYDSGKIEVTEGVSQLVSGGAGVSGETVDDGFEYTTDTSYDWPFTTADNYTYDPGKIEVTEGKASLKISGSSSISSTTLNNSFDTNSDNWTYNDWNQGPGDPNATGNWYVSGGNPNGYIDINLPLNLRNRTLGGYWEQSISVTEASPDSVTCEVDWKAFIVTLPPEGVDSLYVAIYLENASGEPATTPILQKDFTSTFDWEVHSGASGIDCTSSVTAIGTYYYKIAVWADAKNKNTGPINVGFDNAKVSWEKAGSGSYPTDEPSVYPNSSYSAPGVVSWDSFTETATKNGGEIYYQLSDDNGITWKYWNGAVWDTISTTTDYNTASIVNSNISSFATSSEQINFRAFLDSDGTQLVELDNINISLTPSSAVWGFNTWDYDIGEAEPTGAIQSSNGNPDSYADITIPSGIADEVGGYWEQSFITAVDYADIAIDFDYKVIDFNGTPNVSEIRIYLDTTSGEPVTQVGSSILASGEGAWTSATTIDASSAVTTAGTYYLKIAYWVETPAGAGEGPFTVGFDNVDLTWSSSIYPSDSPTIYNTSPFNPSSISSWTSFIETADKNSGEVYYQLSDDNGASWQYWNGATWTSISTTTDYNTASEVNNYINQFSIANKSLMFKAYLASDGTQQIQLDNIDVDYDITTPSFFGNQFIIDNNSGTGLLSNNNKKASLRFDAKNSKTVSDIWIYLEQKKGTSPVYRYGLQSDNSGEPSGVWLGSSNQGYADYQATSIGWQTISLNENVSISADSIYHLVVEYQLGTINSANSIELRQSDPNNFLHPYDSSLNSSSNVLWSDDGGTTWELQGYQPIYILDFTDVTHEGNPYHEVSEHEIYGNNYFGEQIIVSGSKKIISTIGFLVSENNEGPADSLHIALYDVSSSTEIASGILAIDDDITANVYSWQTYTLSAPVTLELGKVYRVYLSSPLSVSQKHYLVRSIYHDNVSALNNVNYDGGNSFFISSVDSGSNWTTTNTNYDINGFRFAVTIFEANGYIVSSAYDTGSPSVFNIVEWDSLSDYCSPNCGIKLQIQTAKDNGGSPGTWSATWCGPEGEDGDDTDYFTVSTGELIHTDHNWDQWIRYKAILTGDSSDTPVLEETRVNYK